MSIFVCWFQIYTMVKLEKNIPAIIPKRESLKKQEWGCLQLML